MPSDYGDFVGIFVFVHSNFTVVNTQYTTSAKTVPLMFAAV